MCGIVQSRMCLLVIVQLLQVRLHACALDNYVENVQFVRVANKNVLNILTSTRLFFLVVVDIRMQTESTNFAYIDKLYRKIDSKIKHCSSTGYQKNISISIGLSTSIVSVDHFPRFSFPIYIDR